jgi:hypothetical protein
VKKKNVVMHHAMKTYGGVDVWLHAFLTLALEGSEGQPHVTAVLPSMKELRYPMYMLVGGPHNGPGRCVEE